MTLTCDTSPVTDSADPRFTRLREILAQLGSTRQRVIDLEGERDEEIARVIGDEPEHGLIVATARAAGLSRQHVDRIRRMARAKRTGQRASPDGS